MNWYKKAQDKDSSNTATVAVFRHNNGMLEVLLGKRKYDPHKGEWGLPGGHVEVNEEIDRAALRELKEETHVDLDSLTFVSKRQRDPSVGSNNDYLFASFIPHSSEEKVEAGSDALATEWIPLNKIPSDLAFEDDKYILIALAKLYEDELKKKASHSRRIITASSNDKDIEVVNNILAKKKPNKKGLLLVIEGIDGAGKSTQIEYLNDWLKEQNYDIVNTKWNSSELLKKTIKKAKEDRILTPPLYCLLHASDMLLRYAQIIEPALEDNKIVLCDRYIYTSMVRDKVRGMDKYILEEVYKELREPDLVFHCTVPIEVAFGRLVNDKGLSYYGSGMDLNLAPSKEENCIKYEKLMADAYKEILKDVPHCYKVDMDRTPKEIFKEIKGIVADEFGIGKYKKD